MRISSEMIPSEHQETAAVIQWARVMRSRWNELDLLFHIPNEGKRSRTGAAYMLAEGMKKGVPDLCLPVARGRYHGLFIEMKRIKGGKISMEQEEMILRLLNEGYYARVCKGADVAIRTIEEYLKNELD